MITLASETPIQLYGTSNLRTSDVKVGDVTGDGLPDIVVASMGESWLAACLARWLATHTG